MSASKYKTLHLFAGAGGGLLADLILGHTPIGAVEIDPYCCQLLREKKDAGWWPQLQVHEIDIRDFDPSEYAGRVDIVAGGFPCQDISAAGRGEGIAGARSGLWTEYVRVLCVLRPRYAFIENSPMLTLRGLDVVLSDLAALGYDAEWAVISAADVEAPHLRERIWILADAKSKRRRESADETNAVAIGRQARQKFMRGSERENVADDSRHGWGTRRDGGFNSSDSRQSEQSLPIVANARSGRRAGPQGREMEQSRGAEVIGASETANTMRHRLEGIKQSWTEEGPIIGSCCWWQSEPNMGRVAHGVAHRVHRLKALGNGQVPLQAAVAWNLLMKARAQRQPDLLWRSAA